MGGRGIHQLIDQLNEGDLVGGQQQQGLGDGEVAGPRGLPLESDRVDNDERDEDDEPDGDHRVSQHRKEGAGEQRNRVIAVRRAMTAGQRCSSRPKSVARSRHGHQSRRESSVPTGREPAGTT